MVLIACLFMLHPTPFSSLLIVRFLVVSLIALSTVLLIKVKAKDTSLNACTHISNMRRGAGEPLCTHAPAAISLKCRGNGHQKGEGEGEDPYKRGEGEECAVWSEGRQCTGQDITGHKCSCCSRVVMLKIEKIMSASLVGYRTIKKESLVGNRTLYEGRLSTLQSYT